MVDSPTHFTSDNLCSLIDLIFVSNIIKLLYYSTVLQFRPSRAMKPCSARLVPHPCRTVWRYKLADFERSNDLRCDWDTDELLDPTSIQRSWETLKPAFLDVMEQCITKSVLPQKRRDHTAYQKTKLFLQ